MVVNLQNKENWYIKQFINTLTDFQKEVKEEFNAINNKIEPLHIEVTKISTMLRDYNGLREKIETIEDRVTIVETSGKTKQKVSNNVLTVISTIVALENDIQYY
jgi:hypothetical protein